MKILFFHRWVGVHGGGSETHIIELAKRFAVLKHDIAILTRQGKRLDNLDKNIKIFRISKNIGESDHSYEDIRVYLHTALFMLKSLLFLFWLRVKGEKFDIISVHFATEAIIARIYRFFTGIPFVFILEGYTPLEAKTARYANLRISISNFEADIYRQRHGVESKTIYVGVDTKRFSDPKIDICKLRQELINKDELLILTVCRLEPRKDIFTLLDAAKQVSSKNDKIKFVIVGEGISKDVIADKIKDLGLENIVKLAGFIDDVNLPSYYKAADLFLLTSKEEWFGIVFIEAMSAGLPVIATNVDACPEVVGDCGLFFEKSNPHDLAKEILLFAADPQMRKDYSNKSAERAKEFDWDKQIYRYQEAYRSVLKK